MSSPSSTPAPSQGATTNAPRRDLSTLPLRPPDAYTFISLKWRRAQSEVGFKEVERALKTKLRQDINLKGDDIKKVFEFDVRRDGDSGAWWFRFVVEVRDDVFENVVQELGSGKSSNLTLCSEEDAYKPRPPPRPPTPPPARLSPTPSPPHKRPKLAQPSSRHASHALPTLPSLPVIPTLPSLPAMPFPTSLPIPSSPPRVPSPPPQPPQVPEDHPYYLHFSPLPPPQPEVFDIFLPDPSRPPPRYMNDSPGRLGWDSDGEGEAEGMATSPPTPVSPLTPLGDVDSLAPPRSGSGSGGGRRKRQHLQALPDLHAPQPLRPPTLPEMPTSVSTNVLRVPGSSPAPRARSPIPALPSMPTVTPSYLLPPAEPPTLAPEDQYAAQMKKARQGISGSLPGVPRKRKVSQLLAEDVGSGYGPVGGGAFGGRSRGATPLEGFASIGDMEYVD